MRFLVQFVLFLACAEHSAAMCEDAWCQYRCMADWDSSLDFCEPNCEKGTGKCKAAANPFAMPGCLTPPGSKDKDDGKKDGGKTGPGSGCSLSSALEVESGTTFFSAAYNITEASGGVFDETGAIVGLIPEGAGPFPLFMWMPGTSICPGDSMPQYQVQQMATRGFVAVAVQYPETESYVKFQEKANAVAGSSQGTALSIMCAHEKVDCSAGVAVGGYSQGTHIAALAAKISDHIKAAYMLAGGRPTAPTYHSICDDANIGDKISKTKRRYITGEADQYFAWLSDSSKGICTSKQNTASNLKLASGYDCDEQPDCLQADGSGYYIATMLDACTEQPDHFNWMAPTASKSEPPKEVATWFKPMNDASLDWLADAATSDQTSKHGWATSSCPKDTDKKPDEGSESKDSGEKPDEGSESSSKDTTEAPSSDDASSPAQDASSSHPVLPYVNMVSMILLLWNVYSS